MSQSQHQTIDLLEIYYARCIRDRLLRDLRRLDTAEPFLAGLDETRRRDVRHYYEAMLITSAELLYQLGDRVR